MFKKILSLIFAVILVFGFGGNVFAGLNDKLEAKQNEIQQVEQKIEELEKQINEKQKEQISLKNQITLIDAEVEKTEAQIKKTETEIEKVNLEITKTKGDIEIKKNEIAKQKIVLGEYIRLIYEYDRISPLEILFGYSSFSDFLDQLENIERLESKGQEALDGVQRLKVELENKKKNLEDKSKDLMNLNNELVFEKAELDDRKEGKENLLAITKDKEEEFQTLLAKAKEEQEIVNNEIYAIEEQIRKQQEANNPNSDNWDDVGGTELAWPINPVQGISAYFMDPSYYTFWGIQHYAIDIPAPQGTPIHAPADGYVAKYSDNGLGYSYIMLYHGNGLSTVFGHASACYVAEGTNVKRGDVIGLSGGMPGTKGAGWMTTGPHLHFEVRINGNPVDPMNYLK